MTLKRNKITLNVFADGVVVVVTVRTPSTLEMPTNETLRRASRWVKENGLTLVHKTEAVLIIEKRLFTPRNLIHSEEQTILWATNVRWLGVQVDRGLRYVGHVRKTTEKQQTTTAAALARLMPKYGR